MAFVYHAALEEWRAWFAAWRHLTTVAFICEDFPCWETTRNEGTTVVIGAQQTIQYWLENSSLNRFEIWLGVNRVELSQDFRVSHAHVHRLESMERTCTIFGRDRDSKVWEVLQDQAPRSAIEAVKLNTCREMCWICQVLITGDIAPTTLPNARWNRLSSPCQPFNYLPLC
jgi:hypothetical protein